MNKTRSIARRLKQLPDSWLFGAVWMVALLTMAAGAALSDARVVALLNTLADVAASAD